jgi:hypothetical protein
MSIKVGRTFGVKKFELKSIAIAIATDRDDRNRNSKEPKKRFSERPNRFIKKSAQTLSRFRFEKKQQP